MIHLETVYKTKKEGHVVRVERVHDTKDLKFTTYSLMLNNVPVCHSVATRFLARHMADHLLVAACTPLFPLQSFAFKDVSLKEV